MRRDHDGCAHLRRAGARAHLATERQRGAPTAAEFSTASLVSTPTWDVTRALAALALAAAISGTAWRLRALSPSGAVAATVIGAIAVAAGWAWCILLVGFFVTSSLLSRYGADEKAARTGGIVAKDDRRDAVQVLANGSPFALAALFALLDPAGPWPAAGAGALAAATSDTWATELGTLARTAPRSILSGRMVPPGTSGGITVAGLGGALAGALFVGLLVATTGWGVRTAIAAAAGGVAGSTLDSLLGATAQTRRWCGSCGVETERVVHDCGSPTTYSRGLRWLDNDVVNAVAGVAGAAIAQILAL